MEYSNLFVCLMGMGTVFVGLICLVVLTTLMSRIFGRNQAPAAQTAPVPTAAAKEDGPIRPEIVAAISAAIAEDLGTDITGIRIKSIKKL